MKYMIYSLDRDLEFIGGDLRKHRFYALADA